MIRPLLMIVILIFSLSAVANSNAVVNCKQDAVTKSNILEVKPEYRIDLKNSNGEDVGAFRYEPGSGELSDLYLCGSNANHYYVRGKVEGQVIVVTDIYNDCLLYTSPSPRDRQKSRMPSSA